MTNNILEVIEETETLQYVVNPVSIVDIVTEGPIGPQGPQGDPGPQGPQGEPGDFAVYTHVQNAPTTQWVIDHNLGAKLNVTVVDTAGTQMEGDVSYPTANRIVIDFAYAFAGEAYLS